MSASSDGCIFKLKMFESNDRQYYYDFMFTFFCIRAFISEVNHVAVMNNVHTRRAA
jgi:hypothetical protein